MKKINRFLILSTLFVSFIFQGCLADAIADDGNGYPQNGGNDTPNLPGNDSENSAGWKLCKNSNYDIFDLQVWGDGAGTFDYENKSDCGRFTILTKGGGWVGGGLICADTTKTFDFTGVAKMMFDIRGNINTKALCIAVQNSGGANAIMYPSKTSLLSSAKINSLDTIEWQSVEFNIPNAAKDTIINAFCIIAAGDWGGTFNANDYFEIKNLDWLDNNNNSVTLKLK